MNSFFIFLYLNTYLYTCFEWGLEAAAKTLKSIKILALILIYLLSSSSSGDVQMFS